MRINSTFEYKLTLTTSEYTVASNDIFFFFFRSVFLSSFYALRFHFGVGHWNAHNWRRPNTVNANNGRSTGVNKPKVSITTMKHFEDERFFPFARCRHKCSFHSGLDRPNDEFKYANFIFLSVFCCLRSEQNRVSINFECCDDDDIFFSFSAFHFIRFYFNGDGSSIRLRILPSRRGIERNHVNCPFENWNGGKFAQKPFVKSGKKNEKMFFRFCRSIKIEMTLMKCDDSEFVGPPKHSRNIVLVFRLPFAWDWWMKKVNATSFNDIKIGRFAFESTKKTVFPSIRSIRFDSLRRIFLRSAIDFHSTSRSFFWFCCSPLFRRFVLNVILVLTFFRSLSRFACDGRSVATRAEKKAARKVWERLKCNLI